MARRLPRKPNQRQKLIIDVVKDFFGGGVLPEDKSSITKIALYLMGRRAKLEPLTEEEKNVIWYIRGNKR